jgi:hypothetical protein
VQTVTRMGSTSLSRAANRSSCSLTRRLIVVNSHAAYIEKVGRASESGVGNALVGSYLTQIGLSENAVVYITQAAPTEMVLRRNNMGRTDRQLLRFCEPMSRKVEAESRARPHRYCFYFDEVAEAEAQAPLHARCTGRCTR